MAWPLRITFWDGEVLELAAKPRVTITLCTPRLMRYLLTDHIAAGAGLCRGRHRCRRPPARRTADRHRACRAARQILTVARRGSAGGRRRRHTEAGDAAAVRYNRLWLDRNMVHSCAYFGSAPTLPGDCFVGRAASKRSGQGDQSGRRCSVIGSGGYIMPVMACAFDLGWLSVYQILVQKKSCGWICRRSRGCAPTSICQPHSCGSSRAWTGAIFNSLQRGRRKVARRVPRG
jgi:hypothetical protein